MALTFLRIAGSRSRHIGIRTRPSFTIMTWMQVVSPRRKVPMQLVMMIEFSLIDNEENFSRSNAPSAVFRKGRRRTCVGNYWVLSEPKHDAEEFGQIAR